MKPIPPDLSTGVAYDYMPVTHINAGLQAARQLRGEPIFKVNRKPRGGGGGIAGMTGEVVQVYGTAASDSLPAGSVTADGLVTWGEDVLCLPLTVTTSGISPNLSAEFIRAKWPSLGSLSLGDSCGCGSDSPGVVPTGVRIDNPTGPDGINRVKNGQTLALSGSGAVPGESLTASIIAINPTTGATVGAALEPTVTNNSDSSWDAAPQSLESLPRGLCLATITNGSVQHSILVLNSLDEWSAGVSNGTGLVYWTDKPDAPKVVGESGSTTDSTEPTFSIRYGGSDVITPGGDVEALLYILDKDTGEVIVATGSLTDFDEGLTIQRVAPTLAIGTYDVQVSLRLAFDSSGYDYDEWWSPPSNPFSLKIVEEGEAVPVARYTVLGCVTTIAGVKYVSVDVCPREVTEDEAEKLDAE
jgi:hypothetical protein